MLKATTSTKRRLLLVTTGWCVLLALIFVIGRMNSTTTQPGPGFGGFLLLFIPSAALLYYQYKGYKAQSNAERLLAEAEKKVDREQAEYKKRLKAIAGHDPVLATILGGSGSTLEKDSQALITCRSDCIAFSNPFTKVDHIAKFEDIVDLEISGPGTEHTNAGMVGGGFGIAGALKGILVASVINKLTSRSTTNTFLRMSTASSETFFHTSALEPKQLRILLSPAIVKIEEIRRLRRFGPTSVSSGEIAKLHNLLQSGAITESEYLAAKQKLLK